MALQRKAYDDFLKWKSAPDRRALLVTGARQVGKTYLIREFGRNEYEVFLEINFIETPKAREIFEGDLDARYARSEPHGLHEGAARSRSDARLLR